MVLSVLNIHEHSRDIVVKQDTWLLDRILFGTLCFSRLGGDRVLSFKSILCEGQQKGSEVFPRKRQHQVKGNYINCGGDVFCLRAAG